METCLPGNGNGSAQNAFHFGYFEEYYALHSCCRVPVVMRDTCNSLRITEDIRKVKSGTDICSHACNDIIPEAGIFLKKSKEPVITVDSEENGKRVQYAEEIFHGITPCRMTGAGVYLNSWDDIPGLHGVENCLMDLLKSGIAHLLIPKYTDNPASRMKQQKALNVLDRTPMYLRCTLAV